MSSLYIPAPWSDAYDGSPNFDGSATVLGIVPFAGTYTLPTNIIADTLTIRTGVRVLTAGYCIMARTLYIEQGGFLSMNGGNAAGASGGTGVITVGHLGLTAPQGVSGDIRTVVGVTNGGTGQSTTGSVGGSGGNGGSGGAGLSGPAGTATAINASQLDYWQSPWPWSQVWRMPPITNGTGYTVLNGGAAGGSGGVEVTVQTGSNSLNSGGGGAGGGIVAVRCGILRNLGTIEARGGNGGNAGRSGTSVSGGAGGGGGGGGGSVHIATDQIVASGTLSAAGGTAGLGASFGAAGADGIAGATGRLVVFVKGEPV